MSVSRSRAEREHLEEQLYAARREWETAQEEADDGVRLFSRVQEVAYEYASHHEVFDESVQRVLERSQDEFFEARQATDQRLEALQEKTEQLQRELDA